MRRLTPAQIARMEKYLRELDNLCNDVATVDSFATFMSRLVSLSDRVRELLEEIDG